MQVLVLLQVLVLRLMLLLLLMRLLMLGKLMLAQTTIHFRVLPRRIDWRYNGGIQFPLLLIFQLSHQLCMLPDGPLVLVVLVVVGVWRRRRVGYIGLGRVQGVGSAPCPCGTCTSGPYSSSTGHNWRLVEMWRSGTRPSLITGCCQGVEERRCRAIYKMPM